MGLITSPLVKEATMANFKQRTTGLFLRDLKEGFVFVGADWCGHCRNAAPEINKLSTSLGMRLPTLFVDGDKPANKQLLNLLGVKGFPTIFLVYDYKMYPYSGERTAISMAAAMCKLTENKYCYNI
jgi:thiol-disulfide isomerase/thioredoxin